MKNFSVVLLSVFFWVAASQAQTDEPKKLEISLFGGLAMAQVKGTTAYSDSWSYNWITNAEEQTAINGSSNNSAFFGAGIGYFLNQNLGIQLSFGYLKSDVPNTSDFEYGWTWASSVGGGTYNQDSSWTGTGSLTAIPICLNLIGKFEFSQMEGFVSGGPALFMNSFEASSWIGFGVTSLIGDTQYIDALQVTANIPATSWTAIGGNIGAGITYKFTPDLGLMIEARYFICGKKDFSWDLVSGKYDGIYYGSLKNMDFTKKDADFIYENEKITTFQVNPSFFQIVAGIKINL